MKEKTIRILKNVGLVLVGVVIGFAIEWTISPLDERLCLKSVDLSNYWKFVVIATSILFIEGLVNMWLSRRALR